MRPSRPSMRVSWSLAWLLGLLVLAGPSGCGPASPGDPSNVGPRAAVVGPDRGREAGGAGRAGGASEGIAPPSVPVWMAPAPASPEVPGRLRALELWAQQPRTGSVDPLLRAVDDPDERVRAKAFALLDDDWARELAAEERAGSAGR